MVSIGQLESGASAAGQLLERVAPGAAEAVASRLSLTGLVEPTRGLASRVAIVSPDHTISMRDLAAQDPGKMDAVLGDYYPKLQRAFPDPSEIEAAGTYRDYLHDRDFPWNMHVLRDRQGNILGGIQSQVVTVDGGQELKQAIWGEHIWLDPEARSFPNFYALLRTAQSRWAATGSDVVFMEFNDRAKMTWQQQLDDASAGLSPEAREKIWGRVGLNVAGDSRGRVAPYAQPAMGDGEPVSYLSLGFAGLDGQPLAGKTILTHDYMKLLHSAHATIPEVDLATDPTVGQYTAKLSQMISGGQTRLTFAALRDTNIERIINTRFVGGS